MVRLILSLTALLTLAACQSPVAARSSAVSSPLSLTVSWNTGTSRTILPASYPTPATYDVVLTPTTGTVVTKMGLTTSSGTFAGLAATIYTIEVTGKDANGNPIVYGTASADLTTAILQSPAIVLTYTTATGTGTGSSHLTFTVPVTPSTASTDLTLVGPTGAIIVSGVPLTGASSTFTYTNTTAMVGSYTMTVKFTSATGMVALKQQSVVVVKNLDTAATVAVAPTDFVSAWLTSVTTIAGSTTAGALDGTGTSARFYHPQRIATDGTNLYVADRYNYMIRWIR